MYAIIFEFDSNNLINDIPNGYDSIRKFMASNYFEWKSPNLYFGNNNIDAVMCILTVQRLSSKYEWFSTYIKDIRLLRIEDNIDLKPIL